MSQKLFVLLITVVLSSLLLAACGGAAPAQPGQQAAATTGGPDADGDAIPDSAEPTLGTDPNNADTDGDGQNDLADPKPLFADNPITETSTTVGFNIDDILVENNVNPGGSGSAPDHLELKVTNTSTTDLSDFDIYYTMKDLVTNDVQITCRTLPGFTLKAGETKALHLDNSGQSERFSVNPNSMYVTSQNERMVDVILHAKGFAPQSAQVKKDAGGAETAD